MAHRALLACSLIAGACGLVSAMAPAFSAVTIAVPDRANAHVSLVARDRFVAAVWSAATPGGPTDIYAAVSRDGGASFAPPARVNATAGAARVNGEQPPRVTLISGGDAVPAIAVIWTAKTEAGTTLLTARSADGGRTFGPSSPVPGTDAAGNRGWEAIGSAPDGSVHAVWLDHRRLASGQAMSHHGSAHGAHQAAPHDRATASTPAAVGTKPDGAVMAQRSDLYFDTIGDSTPPRAVTAGVCYCCKTAIAFGAKGEMYLAWRHVYPGDFRDIAFTVSRDGGRTFAPPARVSEDNWMLSGCPDDGPAMQVDGRGRVHIVWPAVVTERGSPVKALFHAMSADGQSFSPRVRIPTQRQANHPQLAIGADGVLRLAWDESGDGSRRIIHARGVAGPDGQLRFVRTALNGEVGVYPAAAAVAGGAVFAWTSGPPDASVIRVASVP